VPIYLLQDPGRERPGEPPSQMLRALWLVTLALPQALATAVAVLLHGETFRQHGHQDSREVGAAGFADQKAVSSDSCTSCARHLLRAPLLRLVCD
jgi:hypothetical protein